MRLPLHHIVFWHRRAFAWRQARSRELEEKREFDALIGEAVKLLPRS